MKLEMNKHNENFVIQVNHAKVNDLNIYRNYIVFKLSLYSVKY